jgi:hypothetical protein
VSSEAACGRQTDPLAGLELPDTDPGASCLLPPVVRRRASDGSVSHEFHALCWAVELGWSRPNLVALEARFAAWRPKSLFLSLFDDDDDDDDFDTEWFMKRTLPNIQRRFAESGSPTLSVEQTTEHVAWLADIARRQPWPGRTGWSDRRTFMALCGISLDAERPSLIVPGAVRSIQERTSMAFNTVRDSLRRLATAGIIRQVAPADWVSAARFELRWPWVHEMSQYPLAEDRGPVLGTKVLTQFVHLTGHPAWTALGQTCQRLVECLDWSAPVTDAEWVSAAGIKRRAFYDAKPIVRDAMLVEKIDGAWCACADLSAKLDGIAEASGAFARRERIRLRNEVQRRGLLGYRIWSFGLSERFEVKSGRQVIDRSTGEIRPATDAFARSELEAVANRRPVERTTAAYRATWVCPLIPHKRWQDPKSTPVQVSRRSAGQAAA